MSTRDREQARIKAEQKRLEEERNLLLDYALAQKKDYLQAYLRKRDLAFSGTKEILKGRILDHIKEYKLSYEEIADFLDTVEGWGDQSVYLYEVPAGTISLWRSKPQMLRNKLSAHNLEKLINQKVPVLLPAEISLSSIILTENKLQFQWVQKHEWFQRDSTLDKDSDDIRIRGWRRHLERLITRFEIDLKNGEGHLTIPAVGSEAITNSDGTKLTAHSRYQALRDEFETILEPWLGISSFSKITLKKAIEKLETSKEVIRKRIPFLTPEGMLFELSSTIQDKDVFADYRSEKVRGQIPNDSPGQGGSYKWIECDHLKKRVSVKLHGQEQRISFLNQCDESEVRYVLSRIRDLAK